MFPLLMFLLFFAHIEVLRYIGPDIPNVSFHDSNYGKEYLQNLPSVWNDKESGKAFLDLIIKYVYRLSINFYIIFHLTCHVV